MNISSRKTIAFAPTRMLVATMRILFFAVLAISFSACDDDDDKEEPAAAVPVVVNYVYTIENVVFEEVGSRWKNDSKLRIFKEDGTIMVDRQMDFETMRLGTFPTSVPAVGQDDNSNWSIQLINKTGNSPNYSTTKHPKDHLTGELTFSILIFNNQGGTSETMIARVNGKRRAI